MEKKEFVIPSKQPCENETKCPDCPFSEIACPVCGFRFCIRIKKIPAEYTCPNCKSPFSIVSKVSEKVQK